MSTKYLTVSVGATIDLVALLFWLLVFTVLAWPHLQYRNLKAARLLLIRGIERKYGFRVVTMIHRQKRVGIFERFIDIEGGEAVVRAMHTTPPDRPIMVILHTLGGLVLAASHIVFGLKKHPGKKVVVIPRYAMSGGTLIALATDEIWVDPHAVLGLLDSQLMTRGGVAVLAPSTIKVVEQKGADKVSDEALVLADVAERPYARWRPS